MVITTNVMLAMATVFATAAALRENGGFSNDFDFVAQTPKVRNEIEDAIAAAFWLYVILIICAITALVGCCVFCCLWLLSDGDGEPAKAKLKRYLSGGVVGQASHKKLGASKDGADAVVVMLV